MSTTVKCWLLKAEPETRIVKGKDVKFSVDDFEAVKTSPWEGVRNYEARNLMKEMKHGDKALFYHSNCKTPGIAAFAEVSKEHYPDHTAWDPSHPYYDPKSDEADPKWFMVDLTFTARAKNFIPLSLLKFINDTPTSSPIPDELAYLSDKGFRAVREMDLVTRGRLSVQRVREEAWDAIQLLAQNGGWEDMDLRPKKAKGVAAKAKKTDTAKSTRVVVEKLQGGVGGKGKDTGEGGDEEEVGADVVAEEGQDVSDDEDAIERRGKGVKASRKRKIREDDDDFKPLRRSTRRKK